MKPRIAFLGGLARISPRRTILICFSPLAAIFLLGLFSESTANAQPNVVAWGSNTYGQTSVPPNLTNAIGVAAGGYHSAALQADGTVVCWGRNDSGQTNVPAGLSNVIAVACGPMHTLALKADGAVSAWGGPAQVLPPPDLSNVVAVAAGGNATYALFADGSVQSWPTNGSTPTPIGNIVTLGAGWAGSGGAVGTTVNGALYNSTANNPGNFVKVLYLNGPGLTIDGRVSTYSAFRYVDTGLSNIIAISAGLNWPGLALRADGTVYNGPTSVSNAVAIASGSSHSLAVIGVGLPVFSTRPMSLSINPGRTARFYAPASGAWPISYQWQLNGADLPGATRPMLAVSNITAANFGSYQLVASNSLGSATNAPINLSLLPVVGLELTPNLTDVVSVASASADGHYLALKRNGTVVAWGRNDVGQCNVPATLSNVVAISCYAGLPSAFSHSLALTDSGTVYSWGRSYFTNTWPLLTNLGAISAGNGQDTALTVAEGALALWYNSSGFSSPTISSTYNNLTGVTVSRESSGRWMAVRADGVPHAPDILPPSGISNLVSGARGDSYCVGLRADGAVLAWGMNNQGQTNVPLFLTNALQVTTAGSACPVALKDDGTLSAWGNVTPAVSNTVATVSDAVLVDGALALIGNGAPFILDRGIDRVVAPGGQAFFRGMATGERPLHYQWRFNGADLPGQTGNVLQLTNLITAQTGNYTLVVTNVYGSVTSAPSHLTVYDYGLVLGSSDISWTSFGDAVWFNETNVTHDGVSAAQSGPVFPQPAAQQSVLRGTVTGPGTLRFWWRVSGTSFFEFLSFYLNGASASEFFITGETDWQQRTVLLGPGEQTLDFVYRTTFSAAGQHASWVDEVTFTPGLTPVSILNQPQGVAQAGGGDVGFFVGAFGTPPLTFQWALNNERIEGATNASFALRNVQAAAQGIYTVTVSNLAGALLSSNAPLVLGRVAQWGPVPLPATLTNATSLAAGSYHGLALRPDGTLVAWGNNSSGQLNTPAALTNISSIGAGAHFSLATTAPDRTVTAWGDNLFGQTTVPPGLSNVLMVAGGFHHTAALTSDGTVVCWGRNEYGQTNVPPDLTNAVQIAVSGEHNTALRADGTVSCWGQNSNGETNVPPGLSDVVSVRAGFNHSLALKSDGSVVVWGLTNASYHLFDIPANLIYAVSIAAGGEYNLALDSTGQSAWWGLDRYGDAAIPPGLTNLIAITAGGYFTVGLTGGTIPSPLVAVRQPSISNGTFGVIAATVIGRVYRLEYKHSLADPSWENLPLVAGSGREQNFEDPGPALSQRYYRVRSW